MTKPLIALFLLAGGMSGQATADRAWTTIQQGLDDGNPTKRMAAVIALSVVKPQPRPVKMVEAKLQDSDLGVRRAACETLGDMKSVSSIPLLEKAVDDKSPEVVFAAAKALYGMGNATGRNVLTEVLLGDQKDSSGFISTSLRDFRLKLHDPKALLLVGVNEAAGMLIPFGGGVAVAEQLLKDKQASGKTVAALLLATDTSNESKNAVKVALNDKNWTVRAAAARAIALRDLTGDYNDVASLLDDKRDEVSYSAACTLIRLGQKKQRHATVADAR